MKEDIRNGYGGCRFIRRLAGASGCLVVTKLLPDGGYLVVAGWLGEASRKVFARVRVVIGVLILGQIAHIIAVSDMTPKNNMQRSTRDKMKKAILPDKSTITRAIDQALDEDIGSGDLTANLIDSASQSEANLICRENAVLCGQQWFEGTCLAVDPDLKLQWFCQDGDELVENSTVCQITGRSRSILTAERTAINFLQTLSGTATIANQYAKALAGTQTRVLDTRKTVPGMRLAQKYAVAVGGGQNHRIGLFDGVLIKENHIAAAGSIDQAVRQAKKHAGNCDLLEVEVESLGQLKEALEAGVTRIMLDNFDLSSMRDAVEINQGKAELEVSGNVEIDQIMAIANTGVDYISVGALTKHVRAIDFSLRMANC